MDCSERSIFGKGMDWVGMLLFDAATLPQATFALAKGITYVDVFGKDH